jgi:hypothetical protein
MLAVVSHLSTPTFSSRTGSSVPNIEAENSLKYLI